MKLLRHFKIILLVLIVVQAPVNSETRIQDIQNAINAKQLHWTAGENWTTELSFEEKLQLCGTLFPDKEFAATKKITIPVTESLPAKFDWRNNNGNWLTAVKSQGNCGSCWDFSALAQVEAWWKIQNGDPETDLDLSEQFILSCSDAGNCTAGGSVGSAFDFIQVQGVPEEDCFPYQGDDAILCEEKCENWQQNLITIPGWGYITLDEALVDVIKSAVYRHPVSATYQVYEDFMAYSGGIYEHATGKYVGGHAILIVGWNDTEESWICKNSWGPFWGENGYFRIKWGSCNIGTNVAFIWHEMIQQSALQVIPTEFNWEMAANVSQKASFKLYNKSLQLMEFAVQDYEVPIMFHSDDFNAWQGDSWWCGDPEIGGYENHWLQYLDLPSLDLTDAVAPELTFKGFWAIENPAGASSPYDGWDGFNVWISTDGGDSFQVIQPQSPEYNCQSLWSFGHDEQGWEFGPGVAGWGGKSEGWQAVKFDLKNFKSENIVIRFAFASDMGFSSRDDAEITGVFVDDILVVDGIQTLFENYGEFDPAFSRSGFGFRAAEWLEVSESGGIISPNDSARIEFEINTEKLSPGNYLGNLRIATNQTIDPEMIIQCNLSVLGQSAISSVDREQVAGDIQLQQNYPNPFNLTTRIVYQIQKPEKIKILILNLLGQEIRQLFDGFQQAGNYELQWDGRNNSGYEVSSGTYFLKIIAGKSVIARKCLLLK